MFGSVTFNCHEIGWSSYWDHSWFTELSMLFCFIVWRAQIVPWRFKPTWILAFSFWSSGLTLLEFVDWCWRNITAETDSNFQRCRHLHVTIIIHSAYKQGGWDCTMLVPDADRLQAFTRDGATNNVHCKRKLKWHGGHPVYRSIYWSLERGLEVCKLNK